jgi:hypothetical protein
MEKVITGVNDLGYNGVVKSLLVRSDFCICVKIVRYRHRVIRLCDDLRWIDLN